MDATAAQARWRGAADRAPVALSAFRRQIVATQVPIDGAHVGRVPTAEHFDQIRHTGTSRRASARRIGVRAHVDYKTGRF